MNKRKSSDSLFPSEEQAEIDRLSDQRHPDLIPLAISRLVTYRELYSEKHLQSMERARTTLRKISKYLTFAGLAQIGIGVASKIVDKELQVVNSNISIAVGVFATATFARAYHALGDVTNIPDSQQVAIIDSHIGNLSARVLDQPPEE